MTAWPVGPLGGRPRRSNFRDIWLAAIAKAGVSAVQLHDLRHTGNTMAAATGEIAAALGDSLATAKKQADRPPSDT
jgi:integrase